MSPAALLAKLRNCGAAVAVVGDRLRVEAPVGTVTPEMREALAAHKPELLRLLSTPTLDADAGDLAAVKLRNTIIGDCWLVADDDVGDDILHSGLSVFFFDEVEQLRGKTPAELKAIEMVKAEFPTSRVLQ